MVSLLLVTALAQSTMPLFVPAPMQMKLETGAFQLRPNITYSANTGTAASAAKVVLGQLRQASGAHFQKVSGVGALSFWLDSKLTNLGTEGYRLRIQPSGIQLLASSEAGLFYAGQTLRQFMALDGAKLPTQLPCLNIEDVPAYKWRGCHIDVARHFMPYPWLKKLVDVLAMHKLNVLHLHLTDDQGWRIEIKRYPLLTEIGSKRTDSQTNDNPDEFEGKPHSGFYTQAQLRELVAYAAERFVTIVPEIEMPGHSQAAIASYPALGNTGATIPVATGWGVHVDVLNVEDETINFYKNVLDEVMAIFPSHYTHIGGDEAPKNQWKASSLAQARIKKEGLKNEDELQSWFIAQINRHLQARGRQLVGWDEITEGGLVKGATVMVWRSESTGAEVAKQGYDVVMAPHRWTYFDQRQTLDPKIELPRGWGNLSLERVFRFDPMPPSLPETARPHILGAECALWTEVIPDSATAEFQYFPRLFAFADVLWSGHPKPYGAVRQTLVEHVKWLEPMGLRMHPVDPVGLPLLGGWSPEVLGEGDRALEFDVSKQVSQAGEYVAEFEYFGGDNALKVLSCDLKASERVLAHLENIGTAGEKTMKLVVKFRVTNFKPGEVYKLVAHIRGDGGNDSDGDVRFGPSTD